MERTDRAYSNEALNDFSDYFAGAPIALNITGADGTITRANLAELHMLGYDAGEYIGRHLAEFHADPDAVRLLFDRLAAGEPVVEHETTLVRRDGSQQKVLLYANAKITDGRVTGIRCFTFPHPDDLRPDIATIGALTDLSVDRRGVELTPEQRRELYDELADFFENAPVALHIVGGDGLVKHASNKELAAMGYGAESYIGQHIARFHADPQVIDGMLNDLVGGTPLVNFTATLFHSSGEKMPVMIYSNSRMVGGSFVNTRCFTVPLPKVQPAVARAETFAWPRNEDFGFAMPGRDKPGAGQANPMTLALKYIASRKRPEESLGFLARVSEVLGSGRSFPAMLGETAVLTVPFLADFTSIDLETGHLAHAASPALNPRAGQLIAHIDATQQEASSVDGDELLAGLGIRSRITVPIAVRGEHRGVLTLLREDAATRRGFGPADFALAQELARRLAFAIEIDGLTARA